MYSIALAIGMSVGALIAWVNHLEREAEWDAFVARRTASRAACSRAMGLR